MLFVKFNVFVKVKIINNKILHLQAISIIASNQKLILTSKRAFRSAVFKTLGRVQVGSRFF